MHVSFSLLILPVTVFLNAVLLLLSGIRNCSVDVQDCEIVFSIDMFVIGNENEDIYVFINSSEAGYMQLMANPGEITVAFRIELCCVFVYVYKTWTTYDQWCLPLVGIHVYIVISANFIQFAIKEIIFLKTNTQFI